MGEDVGRVLSAILAVGHALLGLTPNQRAALFAVAERPERQLHEVAERARITPVDASKAVRELERLGLVQIRMDAVDRRRKRLTLAPNGEILVNRVTQLVLDTVNPAPPTRPCPEERTSRV